MIVRLGGKDICQTSFYAFGHGFHGYVDFIRDDVFPLFRHLLQKQVVPEDTKIVSFCLYTHRLEKLSPPCTSLKFVFFSSTQDFDRSLFHP